MTDTNEIPNIFEGYEYNEKDNVMTRGNLSGKFMSVCLGASDDAKHHYWFHLIDASVSLTEVEIKPKSMVFITGEASTEKYCALCCKAVASGAGEINLVKGKSLAEICENTCKGCTIVWPLDLVEL